MLPFLLSCPENQSFQYHPEKITLLFQSWINEIKNIFLFDIHQILESVTAYKKLKFHIAGVYESRDIF